MDIEELKEFGLEISDAMKEGKVVIDVYTVWCGPCRFLSPILEKLEEEGFNIIRKGRKNFRYVIKDYEKYLMK